MISFIDWMVIVILLIAVTDLAMIAIPGSSPIWNFY